MPPKRPRRASPTAHGLSAGEQLKRNKLGHDQLAWAWVGTEVTDAAHITQEHRLATCGFSDSSIFPFCSNLYRKTTVKQEKPKVEGTRAAGELEDDIIVVSDDETPACSSKTCKSNPNCLNYLGQEKWENEAKARDAYLKAIDLGPDPHNELREGDTPVGLKNLGATCYANAFLQVWFQDIPFRTGVFNCQPSQSGEKLEESPVFQLQVTFAAMQSSKQSAFNPVKLVESLKLRTTEQQDAQEFSKLFMAHLDTEFHKQSDAKLKSLIADQFQGKQTYATICSRCHNRSEREAEFVEVEVNLANNATLEERVAAMLEPETLDGDNKYFCSQCESLQDATRQTELTELPPVLHFSLLRFVYDFSTMERKKSKQQISFPLVLDMSKLVTTRESSTSTSQTSHKYYLRGILQHKGPSAYHGHYEAQVFDVETRTWYQFNDETVTKIESLFPETKTTPKSSQSGSQQSTKSGKPRAKLQASSSKKRVIKVDSDIEILEDASSGKTSTPPTLDKTHISSRDAYMLVYARSIGENSGVQDATSMSTSSEPENAHGSLEIIRPTPPQRALEVVEQINAQHAQSCDEYSSKQQAAEDRFQNIRQRVMNIYRSWQLSNNSEESVVLSRKALEQWLSHHLTTRSKGKTDAQCDEMEVDSGPVKFSSSDIVCEHGKLDPGEASSMKRVQRAAFDRIVAEDESEFYPVLGPLDVCDDCVKRSFTERLYQVEHPRLVSLFDEIYLVEDAEFGYWISKPWLKDWRLAKPKMHNYSQEDPPPNDPEFESHVRCEHGGLTPNTMSRRRISREAYELLKSLFPKWMTLTTDEEVCAVCEAQVHISKEDKRGARVQAEEEKAKLKHMHDNALNGATRLLEHVPCALVPAQFIRQWKQWLFRPAGLPRPESVDNGPFICRHGLLILNPNIATDMDNSVAVITRGDWNVLQVLYPSGPLITIEHNDDRWTHSPDVCESCRKEKKLNFDMTELTVRVLGPDDPDPTPQTYAARTSEKLKLTQPTLITYGSRKNGGVRQSRRIRQVKESGRKRKIAVLRNMTVKDVKITIQDELDIPTISQRLYYQGVELEDNDVTIDSLGVLANDTLDLREQLEDADLLDSNSENEQMKQRKRQRREEGPGFEGTLLGNGGHTSSGHSSHHEDDPNPEHPEPGHACPACTFQNTPDALACAMCDTMFYSQ